MSQQTNHENLERHHQVRRDSDQSVGILFTVIFAVIALWPLMSGETIRWWAAGISAGLLMLSLVWPTGLKPLATCWFGLGDVLHHIINPVIMAILFFVVVTPFGWFMRLFRHDPLKLKKTSDQSTYWIERDPPGPEPKNLYDQF